jgi:hypothetical protein
MSFPYAEIELSILQRVKNNRSEQEIIRYSVLKTEFLRLKSLLTLMDLLSQQGFPIMVILSRLF